MPEPIDPAFGERFDQDYKSFYVIPDARRFVEHLASLLMTNTRRAAFADTARQVIDRFSVAEMAELQLAWFHREVVYVDLKRSSIREGTLKPYAPEIPPLLRPLFVKPRKYSAEREYRFVFVFQHKRHGALAVRKDPIDLPVIPIQGI
jgi:hypothetical protein